MNSSMNMQDTLKACVGSMQDVPVLVIGDIMLDRFVYGSVERISPESPVPVLTIARENRMLGGAGNALSSLAGLKTKATIISVIGDDADGRVICDELRALGLGTEGLVIDQDRPTTIKTRFLAGHQQLLRSDYEKKNPISAAIEEKILKIAKSKIKNVSALLISDYGKGLLSQELLQKIIGSANEQKVPVIVDPKGHDFSIYRGATSITPNKKELSEAVSGQPTHSDDEVVRACKEIIETCGIQSVIATRSADGMSIVERGNTDKPTHLRTAALEVFDVSGAGDVVIATIAASLAAGASMEHAGALANIAGGIAVSKVGTTPIRAKELLQALNHDDALLAIKPVSEKSTADRMRSAPICDFDEAKEQVQRWRARGLKIGFTNGCFDILHVGHVSYLNEARENCDRLIIGLNTDLSVKALKGDERPVHDEQSRARVLAALGSVDMVVLFGGQEAQDDQTANHVISLLQPDIYFKGGDYKVEDIPETPCVHHYGGQVKVLSVFEGHSTTSSIQKMQNKAA